MLAILFGVFILAAHAQMDPSTVILIRSADGGAPGSIDELDPDIYRLVPKEPPTHAPTEPAPRARRPTAADSQSESR